MSLATQVSSLATRIGTEFKAIRVLISGSGTGDISGLTTTDKSSLVAAINEVKASVASAAGINDATTTTTSTWSSSKINTQLGLKANLASPTFTGTPAAPTPAANNNSTQIATTAYVDAADALKANLASPTFTGTPAAPTAAGGTNTTQIATTAFTTAAVAALISDAANDTTHVWSSSKSKSYADSLLGANDAMVYKGVIDASTNPNYPAANAGDTYKISVAGKIGGASGTNVEVGDMIIATADGLAAGTQAAVGASWTIVQSNIDGAVTGPAASVANRIATFSGTSGKVIQDSGVLVDTDGTLAANDNAHVPTDAAVRTYLGANYYTQTQMGDPTTDFVAVFNTALT